MRTLLSAIALLSLSSVVGAQANANPDYDITLYALNNSISEFRDGPAYPNGTAAIAYGHSWANCGNAHVPWEDIGPGGMLDTFPYLAFLIAREHNGRMEQISNRSFVKYSYATFNFSGGPCGSCQSGPSGHFRMGCQDTYSSGFNASFNYMGPADELDPWLGTRDTVGSYWDRGDPPVSGPAATDNIKSLNSSMWSTWSPIKNRVQMSEATLVEGGTLYAQAYAVIQGEPVSARDNNIMYRGLNMSWGGSNWNGSMSGGSVQGSVLEAWTGATNAIGGNGNDDGRFMVAVKVTGPVAGLYHYEYAVQNIDNQRGAAAFRIPVDAAATVVNAGSKDIDNDGSNDWTFSRVGTEITFSAGVDNALKWNTIYNFWFDCSHAPGNSTTILDQAMPGPGAATVPVNAQAPTNMPGSVATVTSVGNSCGAVDCDPAFYEAMGPGGFDLSGQTMELAWNGSNYSVGSGSATYITPSGSTLSLGDDSVQSVSLPFSLPYPGGSTTMLDVCSNGFISPPGAGNGTDFTPTSSELLSQGARWSPSWHDYSPNAGGQVIFTSNPTVSTVTWVDVPSFGNTDQNTFQVQFRPNGNVDMVWQSVSTAGNEHLVGWSPGNVATDPGGRDLSTDIGAGFSLCANSTGEMVLSASDRPVLGTTIDLTTSGIPAGTGFGAMILSIGQSIPGIPLDAIGMEGCEYYGAGDSIHLPFSSPGSSVVNQLSFPNDSNLTGVALMTQTFTYSPPLTTLGVIGTNGIGLSLGPN